MEECLVTGFERWTIRFDLGNDRFHLILSLSRLRSKLIYWPSINPKYTILLKLHSSSSYLSAVASRFSQNDTHESTTSTAKAWTRLIANKAFSEVPLTNAGTVNLNEKISHVTLEMKGNQQDRVFLHRCESGWKIIFEWFSIEASNGSLSYRQSSPILPSRLQLIRSTTARQWDRIATSASLRWWQLHGCSNGKERRLSCIQLKVHETSVKCNFDRIW